MTVRVAVFTQNESLIFSAKQLALELNYPFTMNPQEYDYLLELCPKHLALVKPNSIFSPLFVDFQSAKMQYRCKHANFRNEILVRALGLKKGISTSIIDGTGGLGRDSFILACLGFSVTLLERSEIIYALLKNGLERALAQPELISIAKRMTLIHADTQEWLKKTNTRPDIIYLDPMFPERKKSAAVKKEMQFFQSIIGLDTDATNLLSVALACANKRVVVKRPRLVDSIMGTAPNFSMNGSSSRFDIYLI